MLVVAVLTTVVAGLAVAGSSAAQAPATPACDWAGEYSRALTAWGENPGVWEVKQLPAGVSAMASVDTGRAAISPADPCGDVGAAVRWAHFVLQLHRMYGTTHFTEVVLGDRAPAVVACAERNLTGCDETDRLNARQLFYPR